MAQASNRQRRSSSMPVVALAESLQLATAQAQTLFRRNYQRVDSSLFWLAENEPTLRKSGDAIDNGGETAIDPAQLWDIIDQWFISVTEEMEKLHRMQQALIEQEAIDTSSITLHNTTTFEAEKRHPYTGRYLALLRLYDTIVIDATVLFLAEAYSNQQKQQAIGRARKLLGRLGTNIITTNTRAVAAVKKFKANGASGGNAAAAPTDKPAPAPAQEPAAPAMAQAS